MTVLARDLTWSSNKMKPAYVDYHNAYEHKTKQSDKLIISYLYLN